VSTESQSSRTPPSETVAVFLAVLSMSASGLAIFWDPFRASVLAVLLALIATGAFELVVISAAMRVRGEPRAALLGLAAACGYALTATLLKEAMAALDRGPAAFFSSWQLYGTAVAGLGALFLLQNALQAGTLVASQPMLTVGDALISISFGVVLYGESVRTGWWLPLELFCLALIVVGCVEIAKSDLAIAPDGSQPGAQVSRPAADAR